MKALLPALGLVALCALAVPAVAEQPAPQSPELIAIKFHADWCGSCKAMTPTLADLKNKLDGEPVLFLTLDLTNQTTTTQAQLLASVLGISDVYKKNAPKTGFVILLDAKTKKQVGKLTKKHSLKQMTAAIRKAI